MNLNVELTFNGVVLAHAHQDLTAAHVGDHRFEFTSLTIEERDLMVWLQPEYLHMPCRARRQTQILPGVECRWTVKAGQFGHQWLTLKCLHAAKRKTRHTILTFKLFNQAQQGPEFNVPGGS